MSDNPDNNNEEKNESPADRIRRKLEQKEKTEKEKRVTTFKGAIIFIGLITSFTLMIKYTFNYDVFLVMEVCIILTVVYKLIIWWANGTRWQALITLFSIIFIFSYYKGPELYDYYKTEYELRVEQEKAKAMTEFMDKIKKMGNKILDGTFTKNDQEEMKKSVKKIWGYYYKYDAKDSSDINLIKNLNREANYDFNYFKRQMRIFKGYKKNRY